MKTCIKYPTIIRVLFLIILFNLSISVAFADKILWQGNTTNISLWTMNAGGDYLFHREYGPYAGWIAKSYANGRLLWQANWGDISLWTVNANGDYVSTKIHGGFSDWLAIDYN